jgi:type II secretory pathway pseudopilin PulG
MVVTVLAIIAGVVVPQVTSVMDEARNAALLKDLREFTFAIERYRMDHHGGPPDLIQDENLSQLLQMTDADGNIGTGPQYPYGPYLLTVPRNSLNGVTRVFRVNSAPPSNLSSRVGWVYHPASGPIWPRFSLTAAKAGPSRRHALRKVWRPFFGRIRRRGWRIWHCVCVT